MTAEQLEELANGLATHLHSEETIQYLARRVLAAERLVEALEFYAKPKTYQAPSLKRSEDFSCAPLLIDRGYKAVAALTAYREASK